MSQVIKADLDEMVFRHRNKEYGAYVLRKMYERNTMRALLFSVIMVASFIAAPVVYGWIKEALGQFEASKDKRKLTYAELAPPPDINTAKPPPPPPEIKPPPPPARATVRFVPPVVKKDEEVKPEETIAEQKEFEKKDAGTKDQEGSTDNLFTGVEEGTGDMPAEVTEEKEPDPDAFIAAEKLPGPVNLAELKKAVGYPAQAQEAQIQGSVVLKVLVDKEGNYQKHLVVRSPHPVLTKAVEAKINMLKFTPAIQGGKPIRCWVIVPVKFSLQN